MILAGKSPPEKEALKEIEENTELENIELYIEKKHLESFEESLNAVENSALNVVSVHTPHVSLSELAYFTKADELARELGAFLVCHSKQIIHLSMPEVEKHGLEAEHGYENQPGASARHLKAALLEKDVNLVLDTAHLYTAEENYIQELEELLEEYVDQIPLMHLCDSKLTDDGLAFGKGAMDMEEVCKTIRNSEFDGILVLEVMPEHQQDALEKWDKWTSN